VHSSADEPRLDNAGALLAATSGDSAVEKILKAATSAEIAARLHWRSSHLVGLMRTVISSTLPNDRREAISLHAAEIEAILKDLERGRFYTVAGIEFWIVGTTSASFEANSPRA
jgi:hypothetical protein